MSEHEPYWHEQIHQIMPDLGIVDVEVHREGLVNDVVIVNRQWVFRFTKTDWGKELMDLEDRLMRLIEPQLSLPVPSPTQRANGVLVYPLLKGKTFLRETWQSLDEENQQMIADQLGKFLYDLHHIETNALEWEVPLTLAPVTRETWLEMFERIVEKVYPFLLPHQIDWVEELFDPALNQVNFFDFQSRLIHGDLSPYHVLYLPETKQLSGVIDFGVAGLGDPATDIGSLINYYGETLIGKMNRTYPDLQEILPRARFYARAIELQWVLLGVESGETYWFTAHIGGARDIL
jgi:aminoglycoside 2''-phosphotransferase